MDGSINDRERQYSDAHHRIAVFLNFTNRRLLKVFRRFQNYTAVGNSSAVALLIDHERVYVHFFDLRMVKGQLRETDEGLFKGMNVHFRFASKAFEKHMSLDALDHPSGFVSPNRCYAENNILEHFHEDPPEPEHE
jgi:hypothetical protein